MTWCFITHFECRCRRWLMIDCNRGLGCQPWWPTLYYLVVLFWSPVLSGPWLVGWKEKKTEIKTNHSSNSPYSTTPALLHPASELTPAELGREHAAVHAGWSQRSNILPEYGAKVGASVAKRARADRTELEPKSNPLITISLSTNLFSRHHQAAPLNKPLPFK